LKHSALTGSSSLTKTQSISITFEIYKNRHCVSPGFSSRTKTNSTSITFLQDEEAVPEVRGVHQGHRVRKVHHHGVRHAREDGPVEKRRLETGIKNVSRINRIKYHEQV